MKKLLIYYSFIIITFMTLAGFLGATSASQVFAASLFYPLAFYFFIQIIPSRKRAIPTTVDEVVKQEVKKQKIEVLEPEKDNSTRFDKDRRAFIKIIGSAGVTVFLFSLFTKKAEAAFFGSVPGPGTVAIKNTSGTQIDPAEKSPTDGYALTEVDDGTTSYYGYINKDGNWYILKEDTLGHYRYAKGTSSFDTNWENRAISLEYGTFDSVF